MAKPASWIAVIAVVVLALVLGSQSPSVPASPDARAARLAADLRCPVCQGLSVKDSDSPTARDLRNDIRRRVEEGESDAMIRQAYVERFGEWILLRPGADGLGALVWALPAAAAVLAMSGLALAFWRWRRQDLGTASAEDRQLVEGELGHPLGG